MQRKWRRDWERGKRNLKTLANSILPPMAAAGLLLGSISGVYANPTDGQIISGSGTITEHGSTMTINQTSDKLGINWQSFSIGTGETVQFIQPGSNSVALNRVLGNDASSIYGSLLANGKVFLINPNGILFAPGASVNVGGIVASTLNITDSDFLAGNYKFSGGGTGSVINQGNITATNYAVLLGPEVKNEGVIAARATGLTAGDAVTLDFDGDDLLNIKVDTAAVGGNATNSGEILADGGLVVMTAGTKSALMGTVVNNSGIIQAQNLNNVNGSIYLEGDTVTNSGTLDASGKAAGQTGGTVKVLGNTVTLADGSKVDVSGDAGGGTALIGGNYQGKGTERNATTTTVAANASINADAITSGNGGKVVVWANDTTNFHGNISAKGGAASGNGGTVETSGKKVLTVTGTVNAPANNGKAGSWLLDPTDYIIDAAAATTIQNSLDGGTDVTIQTDTTGSENGDIKVNSALSWSGSGALTLSAYRNINVNANITDSGIGNISFTTNTGGGGGTLLTGNGGKISIIGTTPGILTINGNAYTLVNTIDDVQNMQNNLSGYYFLNTDISSVADDWTSLNGGAGYTPISAFTGTFEGGGHMISGLTTGSSNSGANIGLFGSLSGATIRNLGMENVTISVDGNSSNAGALAGQASGATSIINCYSTGTVTNNNAGNQVGGLVGYIHDAGSSITASHNDAAVINYSGNSYIGGLVGYNYGGSSVTASYNTGSITNNIYGSGAYVGGLVGYNLSGSISGSYNTGVITSNASGNVNAGGLVGNNSGTITGSYNTGTVKNLNYYNGYYGGLVGNCSNQSNIIDSYSTGLVDSAGGTSVGGLVGSVYGTLINSYSTSTVNVHYTTRLNRDCHVGGLAGQNNGTIIGAFSTGPVSVLTGNESSGNKGVGGLVGYNTKTITNSYSTSSVSVGSAAQPTGGYKVGGLVGWNATGSASNIQNCYATGDVYANNTGLTSSWAANYVGGFLGVNVSTNANAVSNVYSTGGVTSVGATSNNRTGGFIGYNTQKITNAYSIGAVSSESTKYVGGFMGQNTGTLTNTYWDIDTSGKSVGRGGTSGGTPSGLYSDPASLAADPARKSAFAQSSYSGFDFTSASPAWYSKDGATRSFLGWEYSTDITNAHQVQLMIKDLAATYTLKRDIDMSTGTNMTVAGKYLPIGSDPANGGTAFTGTFNGNGYTISELTINNTALNYVGLFGYVGSNAHISNVGLSNVNISGGDSAYVGALAGHNAGGAISNAYSSGTVGGGAFTGGLVGYNAGSIDTSYSQANVTGNSNAGGLVGANSGTITDSYHATGTVTGGASGKAGGIAGTNSGTITRVYNYGPVNGNGGVAGGLVGEGSGGRVIDSVWNTEKSPLTNSGVGANGDPSDTIHALTSVEMRDTGNYPDNWFTSGTWILTGARPRLYCQPQNIIITSLSQLLAISDDLSGVYTLAANITITGDWTPLGTAGDSFSGTLNGNGYTISGLTINDNTSSYVGLFGYTQDATISSLNLSSVNITAGAANAYVGSLAGWSGTNNIFTNCASSGTITANGANSVVGGLVGYNAGSIADSSNAVTVISSGASSIVGGLVGWNVSSGSITASYNAGTVSVGSGGDNSIVGGLVGKNQGSIAISYGTAAGLVTSGADETVVGGLIGENDSSISGLYNAGMVQTDANATNNKVGGLIGVNNSTVTGSFSTGAVTANGGGTATSSGTEVGGLIGRNNGAVTGASFSAGAVTTNGDFIDAGGLAGKNTGTISGSYHSTGTVTTNGADNSVGGLVGKNAGTVTSSYNIAVVTAGGATGKVGGFAGENTVIGSVTDAYSMGAVTGSGAVGGFVGENAGTINYAYSVGTVSGSGNLGGLAGMNDNTGTIANAYWYQSAVDQSLATVGGNTGSVDNSPVQGLDRAAMMQASRYTGWGANWGVTDGVSLPYLTWQVSGTPQFIWGTVQDGGAGKTVVVHNNHYGNFETKTLTNDGFYYTIVPDSFATRFTNQTVEGQVVLLYVADNGNFKANSLYLCGTNGLTGGDLSKDTLIIKGTSGNLLTLNQLYQVAGQTLMDTSPDLLFANPSRTIQGDLLASEFLLGGWDCLNATGSITINNTGDFYLNVDNQAGSLDYGYLTFLDVVRNQQITAGGNINITTGGRLLLKHGNPENDVALGRSAATQLIAGGDVILHADGGFANYSGPEAIQAGGRWLVYAPDQLVASADRTLYFADLYTYRRTLNEWGGYYMPGVVVPAKIDEIWKNPGELYVPSNELVKDVRGGLSGDFVLWAGDTVPATGSGFVFAAANPALRALTPTQLERREAVITAHSGTGSTGFLQSPIPSTTTPGTNADLPFLTIIDGGIATEEE